MRMMRCATASISVCVSARKILLLPFNQCNKFFAEFEHEQILRHCGS